MRLWSRHSLRAVRIQRSANALDRVARVGVRTIRTPSAVKTASNAPDELRIPIPDQERELGGPIAQIHHQLAGLLRHPLPGRMGCGTQ